MIFDKTDVNIDVLDGMARAHFGAAISGVTVWDGKVRFDGIDNPTAQQAADMQALIDGIGAWSLTATERTAGGVDVGAVGESVALSASDNVIRISGPDAACTWTVYLDGVQAGTESDTSAPFELDVDQLVAGVYRVVAVASGEGAYETGDITFTVEGV